MEEEEAALRTAFESHIEFLRRLSEIYTPLEIQPERSDLLHAVSPELQVCSHTIFRFIA
jgi:hypothetical protein